ncbi:hypothetical protein ACGFIF_44230 [Kribbella sp. NPDC049174]|uniref:hypothetical protein n=1 Tax=Kribbella sp. NPDC049174 TaxID=3364112 RepID=UPI003722CCBF
MNPTLQSVAAQATAAGWPISTPLMAVLVLGAVLLMVAAVYCVVVLLAVLFGSSVRRADARRVLRQVGETLIELADRLVDLAWGRRRKAGRNAGRDDDRPAVS